MHTSIPYKKRTLRENFEAGLQARTTPDPHAAKVSLALATAKQMRNNFFPVVLTRPNPLWEVRIDVEGSKPIATLSRWNSGRTEFGTKVEVPQVPGKATEYLYSDQENVLAFRSHWNFLILPFDQNGRPTLGSQTYRLPPQGEIKSFHLEGLNLIISNDAGQEIRYDLLNRAQLPLVAMATV